MAGPKFHIARSELELGLFPQTEVEELLQAGFLLPTDLFWSAGQTARRPLSELVIPAPGTPVSLTERTKVRVISAAESVRASATHAMASMVSVANQGRSGMSAAADRVLLDYLPRLRGLVTTALQKTRKSAESALHDEVFLRKLFGAVHDVMPRPVRRFVSEETFVEFCLRNKQRLLGKD